MNQFQYTIKTLSKKLSNLQLAIGTKGALILLLNLLLVSCSDDLSFRADADEDDDFISISLMIPDVDWAAEYGSTRNDEFRNSRAVSEASEGTINSLWFFAFADEKDPDGALTKITELSGHSSLNISSTTGYKEYNINNFHTGNYHIYLLANFDDYLPVGTLSKISKEDELLDLVLSFSPSNPLKKDNLPMYCLSTQIKANPSGGPEDPEKGIFNLNKENIIYADLNFLCAKIRYTVLFDRTDFSKLFASNNVNINEEVNGENLCNQTALNKDKTLEKLSSWNSTEYIYKVSYPSASNNTSKYLNISAGKSPDDSPPNLSRVSDWSNQAKRAWQGIAYLPENLLEDNKVQSYLALSSIEEDVSKDYSFSPRKLERGQMYDLVAKLKKSDIEVEVNVSEWTLQELAYKLHGQYELIVEKTQLELESGKYVTVGYHTDTFLSFDIPTININGDDIPFYIAEFITDQTVDENGNPYSLPDGYDGYFRISVNPKLPYKVIYDLAESENKNFIDDDKVEHTSETLGFFHVSAGNLHKKITTSLNLKPYLNVYPQIINIDTREYYLSANDEGDIFSITFHTNYPISESNVDLYFHDPSAIVKGVGELGNSNKYDLQLFPGEGIDDESVYENYYRIAVTDGELKLNVTNLIGAHKFWKEAHTFTIKFTLNITNPYTNKITQKSEEVVINIKPYTTDYIIHFHDATNTWRKPPHIFVYQDLLLPSDMSAEKEYDDRNGASKYANGIVGYVEWNENNQQHNAAAQYVFSNNISFRGWKGYGGPDINDPYDIYIEYFDLIYKGYPGLNTDIEYKDGDFLYDRQGFVMLGKPVDNYDNHHKWIWNDDYGYTNRNKRYTDDGIQVRRKRYNYDVNFNEAHEKNIVNSKYGWPCDNCRNKYKAGSRYNDKDYNNHDNEYDYPGIVMEKEDDSGTWWKYTLTGVAQPGKTMIIFADTEEPWNLGDQNDHRYPGAYDTGLPLFDFEDNEGWFEFKGRNTSEEPYKTPHYFTDEKPQ